MPRSGRYSRAVTCSSVQGFLFAEPMTAADALSAGASYIVVGRPILAASDPRAAAERIAADCVAARAS